MREFSHKTVIPAMYLVIGIIFLLASASKYCFAKAQQPPLPQTQKEARYVLQNMLKTNPAEEGQLKILPQAPDNMTAKQAHFGPVVNMAINAIGEMLKPNNETAQVAKINSRPGANAAGELNASNLLSQSTVLQEVLELISDQIQEGQIEAAKNNITIGNNMASLFGLVSPLKLLKDLAGNHPARQILQNSPQGSVNEKCLNDLTDMVDSAVAGKMWALNMIDADGKPSAGILRGSFYFVGSYDECILVKPSIKAGDVIGGKKRTSSSSFNTRFCRIDIAIPKKIIDSLHVNTHGIHLKVTTGLCVPDSCRSSDVKGLFSLGQLKRLKLKIENSYCYGDKDLRTDNTALVAIFVLAFFAFLIVFGTLCDIAKRRRVSKKQIPMQEESINESRYTSIRDLINQHPQTTSVEIISSENQDSDFPSAYMPHRENYRGAITIVANSDNRVISNGSADIQGNGENQGEVTSSLLQEDKNYRDPLIERMLICFSVYTNAPKLLNAHTGRDAITCVHGIRFLSLTWVIIGHTYSYGILSQDETFTTDNLLDFAPIYERFTFQAVIGGGFAVDTFFVLSAFLVTWLQLKDIAKRTKKCSIGHFIMYYFHRFWRLTPLYMLVLMAFACLYQYLGSGPFWPSKIWDAEHCKTNWWTNLLYVNNVVGTNAQCMAWSWYLAVDMQFYVITPIFLALMYWNVVAGIGATVALLATCVGITYWKEHEVH
ncbi:O-acyltransferase like protein-like isoform X2 [Mya arenaria]|uniref:O-acyltransferase like protein-like isoform X2 n=1 Tax=Mya arenaria TaxID=6604 RepID=UPI0022E80C2A|nr:O-acyltransferase like protein-like isoform X2 [Mya arenaria]